MRGMVIIMSASMVLWVKTNAQTHFQQFFKKINTLDRPLVSYDYKVSLYNNETRKVEDSIVGKIYKKSREYLDSSSVGVVAVSGNYYCKVDLQRKEALVYNIDLIQKKLNLQLDTHTGEPVVIPDSIISRYSDLTLDTNKACYIYHWTLKNNPAASFSAAIEKGTLRLLRVTIETQEGDSDEGFAYKRICTIYNIKNEFPASVLDLRRFCNVNGDKVTLNSKYAGYNLKTLIN